MIREKWEQILQDKDVRQNLSAIRKDLKNSASVKEALEIFRGQEQELIALLQSEDAKSRKNAALLMGDLGSQKFLVPVWETYQKEEQRFIKSSYLNAIGNFDYRDYIDDMKEQLEALNNMDLNSDNQKHITEEMRALSALIIRMEGVKAHTFSGWNETYDVILLTNRNFIELTAEQLKEKEPNASVKTFGAGIMAKVENLSWIKDIRTYQELLFVVEGMRSCELSPEKAADTIVKSQLLKFLSKSHGGTVPYYFRIEFKSKKDLDQKSAFVKKLSAEIEKKSGRRLVNTTDRYEFEIRLIENKNGNCNMLVKLYTLKDKRFLYRKEYMPSSIRPVNAALTAALAKEYMKEDAQILDPFCGVGTMLIERNKTVMANTTYGIDIQEQAILKARQNTEAAGQIAHYINRDFFQFQHDYLFDEVITDMPFEMGKTTAEAVRDIYRRFFQAIPEYIKPGAILILYSRNRDLVKKLTANTEFTLLKEHEISKREETYVVILRYKSIL